MLPIFSRLSEHFTIKCTILIYSQDLIDKYSETSFFNDIASNLNVEVVKDPLFLPILERFSLLKPIKWLVFTIKIIKYLIRFRNVDLFFGEYCDHNNSSIHIEDRGFQFADGVYEVFGIIKSKIVDLSLIHI